MKVLNSNQYQYLGIVGSWHVFKCIKKNFDPEILYLDRARMILEDGSSRFFDPVKPNPTKCHLVELEDGRQVVYEKWLNG